MVARIEFLLVRELCVCGTPFYQVRPDHLVGINEFSSAWKSAWARQTLMCTSSDCTVNNYPNCSLCPQSLQLYPPPVPGSFFYFVSQNTLKSIENCSIYASGGRESTWSSLQGDNYANPRTISSPKSGISNERFALSLPSRRALSSNAKKKKKKFT